MLNLPHSLKSCVHARLQPVVEEWSGLRLKQTLLYGLRIYTNGAVLDEHVDTLATHVVSLILNVGQEGMEVRCMHAHCVCLCVYMCTSG